MSNLRVTISLMLLILVTREVSGQPDDFPDTCEQAVGVGFISSGVLTGQSDADWVEVLLQPGRLYQFSVSESLGSVPTLDDCSSSVGLGRYGGRIATTEQRRVRCGFHGYPGTWALQVLDLGPVQDPHPNAPALATEQLPIQRWTHATFDYSLDADCWDLSTWPNWMYRVTALRAPGYESLLFPFVQMTTADGETMLSYFAGDTDTYDPDRPFFFLAPPTPHTCGITIAQHFVGGDDIDTPDPLTYPSQYRILVEPLGPYALPEPGVTDCHTAPTIESPVRFGVLSGGPQSPVFVKLRAEAGHLYTLAGTPISSDTYAIVQPGCNEPDWAYGVASSQQEYVRVSTSRDLVTGIYANQAGTPAWFTWTDLGPVADPEGNVEAESAALVPNATPTIGTINYVSDRDVFNVQWLPAHRYALTIHSLTSPRCAVYVDDGRQLSVSRWAEARPGESHTLHLYFGDMPDRSAYARVWGEPGEYEISVQDLGNVGPDELPDECSDAPVVHAAPWTYTTTLQSHLDEDWIKFELAPHRKYRAFIQTFDHGMSLFPEVLMPDCDPPQHGPGSILDRPRVREFETGDVGVVSLRFGRDSDDETIGQAAATIEDLGPGTDLIGNTYASASPAAPSRRGISLRSDYTLDYDVYAMSLAPGAYRFGVQHSGDVPSAEGRVRRSTTGSSLARVATALEWPDVPGEWVVDDFTIAGTEVQPVFISLHAWPREDGLSTQGDLAFRLYNLDCPGDWDGSGTVTGTDIFAYLDAWFVRDDLANIDDDAFVTATDLFIFLDDWFKGCQ